MIKKTENYKITNIFEEMYEIPPYQREYSWGKEQLENFFNDLYENDDGYFLGSLICIHNTKTGIFEVVDGQQRLTTISILKNVILKAISNYYSNQPDGKTLDPILNREKTKQYLNLEDSILTNTTEFRLSLSIQKSNNIDYKYLCYSENKLGNELQAPPKFGIRRIKRAYNYFMDRLLEKNNEGEILFSIDEIYRFLNKLNSATLVRIDVEDATSAFILFESINNRGTPLSPIDLIKNMIIGKFSDDPEAANDRWQTIIKNIEDYNDQVRYVRHYYHAFQSDKKIKLSKYKKATRSNIIKIYEEHIKKRDAQFIFEELIEKSKIYNLFVSPENIEKESENRIYQNKLVDLKRLGIAPGYAFMLYVFSCHKDFDKSSLLALIEKWFIRRHITDFPATRDLDSIFINLIDIISNLTNDEKIIYDVTKDYLTHEQRYSSEQKIEESLKGRIYDENYQATRYMLIKLEESKRDNLEENIDFWALNPKGTKKTFIWTVEHILPQNPDKKSDWDQFFNDIELDKYVHKIGNLTLTGYNSSLSNKSFSKKCENENGLHTGRVKINDYLLNKREWAKNNIDERSTIMINEIMDLLVIN